MEDSFGRRVRAAAAAGWWTALIATAWMLIVWLVWLGVVKGQPVWVLQLWGMDGMAWPEVQRLMLYFFGIMKLVLWVWVLICIWLTIWARRLRQTD
jgi:hypothetical protein